MFQEYMTIQNLVQAILYGNIGIGTLAILGLMVLITIWIKEKLWKG